MFFFFRQIHSKWQNILFLFYPESAIPYLQVQ
nr:MAG TPA: hypothetical protein [Caudoviricetes sp.]